jgi:hypothetical protein
MPAAPQGVAGIVVSSTVFAAIALMARASLSGKRVAQKR